MHAFDYDAQKWVDGAAAVECRRLQLVEEREIISGPRGAEYLTFARKWSQPLVSVADALAAIDRKLTALSVVPMFDSFGHQINLNQCSL